MKQQIQSWNQESLKEVLITLESGGRPTGGAQKEGIPSIGGEHLNYNGRFNFETMKFIPEDYFNSMNRGIINKEDVLIVKDGATTGKTSFVDNNFPYEKSAVNEHVFIARPNEKIFPKYLFYYLYSGDGQEQLKKCITGSAQGGINLSILDKILVVYPSSKDYQKQIVSAIETHFSRLDNAIQNLKSVKNKIQLYRKAVLKKAFEKKGGWEEKKIGEITATRKEKSNPKEYPQKSYIGMAHVESDNGKIIEEHFAKEMKATSSNFYKGDVLYGRLRPYLNKVVDADFEGLCSTEFIILMPKINYNFLGWRLRSLDFVNFANSLNTGDRPRVKFDQIANFKIYFPKDEVGQLSIVSAIEAKFSIIDKVEDAVDKSLVKAERLRKSILKSAFEGRLVE